MTRSRFMPLHAGRLFSLLSLLLLLNACDWMPGKPDFNERPILPTEVMDFDTLYGSRCAGCHGQDGSMGAARNLADPIYLSLAGDDVLTRVTQDGVPDSLMPSFGEHMVGGFTKEQVNVLIQGVRERWGDAKAVEGLKLPPYSVQDALASGNENGDVKRGAAAFETFCTHCHGEGKTAGNVLEPNYLALVSDQALRTAVICGRTDLGMPDWRHLVEGRPMTAQEITDVVAWMTSHREEFPRPPAAKNRSGGGR